MFANYLSRKNFSHTRANRRRNASPVGLPTAPVSITSQEAAFQGPLWSSSGKTCLFHEEDPGRLRHALLPAWGRSGLVALEVFVRPQLTSPLPPLFSPPASPLPSFPSPALGQTEPQCRKRPAPPLSCCPSRVTHLSPVRSRSLLPHLLCPSSSPSSSQAWLVLLGREGKKLSNPWDSLPTLLTLCLQPFIHSEHTEGLRVVSILGTCMRPRYWVGRRF